MIRNLQGLRGIACILIYYHHFGFGTDLTMSFGDYGVSFFMMLSGFVLYLSHASGSKLQQTTVKTFMKSRLLKIYPLYILCWIIAVAVLPYRGSRSGIILGSFMLQSWIPIESVYFAGNAVGWFISDLMAAYLLFLPLTRLMNRRAKAAATVLTAYFLAYLCVVFYTPESMATAIIYINPIMQLSSFILGILVCKLYLSAANRRRFKSLQQPHCVTQTIAEFLTIAITCIAIYFYPQVSQRFSLASYWWLPVASAIIIFTIFDRGGGLITTALHSRLILNIGEVSFVFYLIHYVGISVWKNSVVPYIPLSMTPFIQSVILVIILLALSSGIDCLNKLAIQKLSASIHPVQKRDQV